LDRDGVLNKVDIINGKPFPPDSLKNLEIYDDVYSSLEKLRKYNYKLIVVTNQPDIARGKTDFLTVSKINAYLYHTLKLDGIYMCTHDSTDFCSCRKPRPGMIYQAANDFGLSLTNSFLIGDRWRDVEAAQNSGCEPIFINRKYCEKLPTGKFLIANSLQEATNLILLGNLNERNI